MKRVFQNVFPLALLFCLRGSVALAEDPVLRVRYVARDAVYLNGGRKAGLAEGFTLTVKRLKPGEAELSARTVGVVVVTAVAANSTVCKIQSQELEFEVGDVAELSGADAEAARMLRVQKNASKYVQVVAFTEGDPLEEEQRAYVPRPPLPEINRVRGRLAYEFNSIRDHGPGGSAGPGTHSSQQGVVLRADMTRIGGSYWNFTGYWRGRVNSRDSGPDGQTLTDLLNRTYHIGLYYNNPESRYVAGFGRLLVPWASSLNTIDGGYFGRRVGKNTTLGIFAGSTPDPTSWNYNPDRQMAGAFANFEAGSFDSLRYTGTVGVAVTRLRSRAERQFLFLENSLLYRRNVSFYHNVEVDQLVRGRLGGTESGARVSRSFLTFRVQPHRAVSLDLNHNYFRNVPTFDARLAGTGLLDRLLFQGLSAGIRVDLPHRIGLYSSLGRNLRSGDARPAWNRMYGVTLGNVWRTGLRADFRHVQFDSSFGRGSYDSLSVTRELRDVLRLEVQVGRQSLTSAVSQQNRAHFVNSTLDWFLGRHYWIGFGFTAYRGRTQNYDQILSTLGYRF